MAIRVGLVGLGFMGMTHARIYRALPGAELAAVCDIQPDRLAGTAAGGNIDTGAAGVDFSQLSVSSGDGTLATSVTNCDLVVVAANKLGDISGQTNTIVTAPGAGFSSSTPFHSVTWPLGWNGHVNYNGDTIQLVNVRKNGGTALIIR